jgi:hypothetical protein
MAKTLECNSYDNEWLSGRVEESCSPETLKVLWGLTNEEPNSRLSNNTGNFLQIQ